MKQLFIALVSLLFLASCGKQEEKEIIPMIEGVPTMKAFADSLNTIGAKSLKWAVNDSTVYYSTLQSVNWKEELDAFIKSNVNSIRFRDAFDVTDTTIGKVRSVRFEPKNDKQEVKYMEVKILNRKIIYYEMVKERDNVFSTSRHRFTLDQNQYTIEMYQKIPFFLETDNLVQGTIIPKGTHWRGELNLGDDLLPFRFVLITADEYPRMIVRNGLEEIGFEGEETSAGNWVFSSDYYNSRFEFAFENDSTLSGKWVNAKRDKVVTIPFSATSTLSYRFPVKRIPDLDITGEHAAIFYDTGGNPSDTTLLILEQNAHQLSGSFLTTTGDYRFLEGVITNDSLKLSAIDGTHSYLFQGKINADKSIDGTFSAGLSWRQIWTSTPDAEDILSDPEAITQMVGDTTFTFSFPDQNGKLVSLSDSVFANKPVAITLMGTWCSNCFDEAQFLKEAYEIYHPQGFEVVAIDFELTSDSATAWKNIKRHTKSLDVDYPILLATLSTSKQKAAKLFPQLSGFYSYPTLILLDRDHKVVKIHTGFTGPAAGRMHYELFRRRYLRLIDSLVAQP